MITSGMGRGPCYAESRAPGRPLRPIEERMTHRPAGGRTGLIAMMRRGLWQVKMSRRIPLLELGRGEVGHSVYGVARSRPSWLWGKSSTTRLNGIGPVFMSASSDSPPATMPSAPPSAMRLSCAMSM